MTAAVKAANFKWTDEASGTAVTTIKVGGTVTWTVAPGAPHSLEKVAGSEENGCGNLDDPFNSPLAPGQSVSRTFTKVGIFGYHCGIHKGVPNCKTPPGDTTPNKMPGVIKVVP
jgi:plastocyanin